MNPYAYYKEGWADHVSVFWQEFMEDRREIEIVLENVFDNDWELLLDVYQRVKSAQFQALPGYRTCALLFHRRCSKMGGKSGTLCVSCPCP